MLEAMWAGGGGRPFWRRATLRLCRTERKKYAGKSPSMPQPFSSKTVRASPWRRTAVFRGRAKAGGVAGAPAPRWHPRPWRDLVYRYMGPPTEWNGWGVRLIVKPLGVFKSWGRLAWKNEL